MYRIFAILLSFCIMPLTAQEVLTLEKAIALGLEQNYGIKMSDIDIQVAENNNTWARAGGGPTVDLRGTFANNFIQDNNPASFVQGTFYTGSLGVAADANWVVYAGGRIRVSKDRLAVIVDQRKLQQDAEINLLLRDIYQQYYEVIFQQEQLDVLKQILDLSNDRLAYEDAKREFGSSNTYNLIQFQTAILSDSNAVISQVQLIEVAKRNLYNLLDMQGSQEYEFSEKLSVNMEEIDIEKLASALREDNYTLKSLQVLATLEQLNIELAKAANRPTVSLNGSIGFAENGIKFFADDPNTGMSRPFLASNRLTGSIGATLSYNLYDGDVRDTDIANAKLQQEVSKLSIVEATAELENQLAILVDNYQNQIDLIRLADQQIKLSQRNLLMTEERFKAGQLTSLDYRNVQNQYLSAAFSKVRSMYELLIIKIEIDTLVGMFGGKK